MIWIYQLLCVKYSDFRIFDSKINSELIYINKVMRDLATPVFIYMLERIRETSPPPLPGQSIPSIYIFYIAGKSGGEGGGLVCLNIQLLYLNHWHYTCCFNKWNMFI